MKQVMGIIQGSGKKSTKSGQNGPSFCYKSLFLGRDSLLSKYSTVNFARIKNMEHRYGLTERRLPSTKSFCIAGVLYCRSYFIHLYR